MRLYEAKDLFISEEEQQLANWFIAMAKKGYGLCLTSLKMKVSETTMSREIPFWNGIHGGGWMGRWKQCHPKLTLGPIDNK